MHMYNYFLKARVSLRTLSSPVINLFTQVAIVLELALVSSQVCSTGAYEDTTTLEKPWHSVKFLELVPGFNTLRAFHCINI